MTVQLNPYLNFRDETREAMAFYQEVFGGELAMSGDDEPTLRGFYDALVDGGTVIEPLEQAPWGDHFGMCIDRFGVHWMVNIGSSPG